MSIQPRYNTTPYQRGMAAAIEPLRNLDVLVGAWNDPETMAVSLLPYKAMQLGCLAWSDQFGEDYQRAAVAASTRLNEQAGSVAALDTLDELLRVSHNTEYSSVTGGVARSLELTLISSVTYNAAQVEDLKRIYSSYLPVWLSVTIVVIRPIETGVKIGNYVYGEQEIEISG